MSYLSLDEAAQYVARASGKEIESASLLRMGCMGHMLIVGYFDGPMRNLTTHENEDYAGHLVVAPRHLAGIENDGQATITLATSLDGGSAYSPQVVRARAQLRVLVSELDRIIPSVVEIPSAQSRAARAASLTDLHVIEIASAAFVLAEDIPNWIAVALCPRSSETPTLRRLQKTTLLSPGNWAHSDCTDQDYGVLDVILGGRLTVSSSTTKAEWAEIEEAFDRAPNRPEWGVLAQFSSPVEDSNAKRSDARREHFKLISASIASGALSALTPVERSPTTKFEPGTLISIADARNYLAQYGFELRIVEADNPHPTGISPPPSAYGPKPAPLAPNLPSRDTGKGKRNKWDEMALRTLYAESILPESSTAKLSEKYGISRQAIEKQLKAAEKICKVRSTQNARSRAWGEGLLIACNHGKVALKGCIKRVCEGKKVP